MRNLSCFLTQAQVRDRSKTVSRRIGWGWASPGQIVRIVVKGQGLKPGEKIQPMAIVEFLSVTREPLSAITADDVVREGFPAMTPAEFVAMFCHHMGTTPDQEITRLEWRYRDDLWAEAQTEAQAAAGAISHPNE